MIGFTINIRGKDYFFVTERRNKTDFLAREIIRKLVNTGMDIPDAPEVRKEILYRLQKARCEIRQLANGRRFYEIAGDGFGGRGSFVDDGMTVVIHLNK